MKSTKHDSTVDTLHHEIMDQFYKEETIIIPKVLLEIDVLQEKRLNPLNKKHYSDIDKRINRCNKKITKLTKRKKEYLLNNSKYVFEYFTNKKEIDKDTNKKTVSKFFNIDNSKIDNEPNKTVIDKYLKNVDSSNFNIEHYIVDIDICKSCTKGELIPINHEGVLICNHCAKNYKYLVENEKPSYKEPPKEVCFYAYKRINHFREILAQFQAKETTDIPEEIIERMKLQIKKERIDVATITNKTTKDILKKLGYNKYYEHIPFIKDKLGIRPPVMSPALEDTLCNLFMDIQAPYAKFCPRERVNFLNYYYTVYKLCELLDQTQFLPYFPMLKDREKRIEQDNIWKKICRELNWEFISTI